MGIIHRDIKPSNLMLEVRNAECGVRSAANPSPSGRGQGEGNSALHAPHSKLYITDFGLAHIETSASLTITGDVLGTIRYMSPEQAEGRFLDHRTDIYSLGVTLYELLTLRPALLSDDRQTLIRQIANDELTTPRKLNPAVPIDLETIILKSAAKEPVDRYQTAGDLAGDLRRFVASEPIRAKPPTVVHRAVKWCRRHPGVLVSSTLLLLVALAAAVVAATIADAERAKTTLALAEKGRALTRAEQDLGVAIDAVDAMYTDVATSWIANETAPTTMQQKFLQRATHFYELIAARTPTSDAEQILAARVYDRIGQIQLYLGNAPEAAAALRNSIAIDENLVAGVPEQKSELPSRYRRLAEALIETADNASADETYRTGLRYIDRIVDEDPSSVAALEEQVHFYHGQAALWARTDQLDKSEAAARLAADQIQKISKLIKRPPRFLTEPNDYLLARILNARGEHAAAREQAEKALKGCRRVRMVTFRDAREPLELEIDLLQLLAEIREAEGALEQSAEHYREALDLRRSNFKARLEPADFIVQTRLTNQDNYDGQFEHAAFCRYIETQLRLARVLGALGRADEAEHILGECTLAAPVIWAHRENMVRYHVAEANAWALSAELLAEARPAEAEPARQHAILIWRHILAWFPGAPAYRSGVHGAINDFQWFRARLPAAAADSLTPHDISASVRLTRPEIPFKKNAADRSWKDAEQAAKERETHRARMTEPSETERRDGEPDHSPTLRLNTGDRFHGNLPSVNEP
jgi:tetratricopeptide (TPR) repeat protein